MRVAVIGSRSCNNHTGVYVDLDRCLKTWGPFVVVSGGAKGADALAKRWAEERSLPYEEFPVTREEWDAHGKAAGPMRNRRMIATVDCVVAFWDGQSTGTASALEAANARGIPVFVRPAGRMVESVRGQDAK